MAKFKTSGFVKHELVIDTHELLGLLRREYGIPEGVAVDARACQVHDGEVASNLGPRIDLERHGLLITWQEFS